jgi:hypothetical protein
MKRALASTMRRTSAHYFDLLRVHFNSEMPIFTPSIEGHNRLESVRGCCLQITSSPTDCSGLTLAQIRSVNYNGSEA